MNTLRPASNAEVIERGSVTLARRVNESLILGLPDGRTVTVTHAGWNGQQVRLRVNAPKDVRITREPR